MDEVRYMISEAAKKLQVESHVLRYWEEELGLTIGRTDMGHRYYTEEDIQLFLCIQKLKNEGMLLRDLKFMIPELTAARKRLNSAKPEESPASVSPAGKGEADSGKDVRTDAQADDTPDDDLTADDYIWIDIDPAADTQSNVSPAAGGTQSGVSPAADNIRSGVSPAADNIRGGVSPAAGNIQSGASQTAGNIRGGASQAAGSIPGDVSPAANEQADLPADAPAAGTLSAENTLPESTAPASPQTASPEADVIQVTQLEQVRSLIGDVLTDVVSANNETLKKDISRKVTADVIREMDFLFQANERREEEHYRKLDTLIRQQQASRREAARETPLGKLKKLLT